MKKMKIILTIIIIVALASSLYYYFLKSNETYPYVVLQKFQDFEIRKYDKALFSSVELNATDYESTPRQGFNILAGFIFGANDKNEKISMTTPVLMNMGKKTTVQFLIPSKYGKYDLPMPQNSAIEFKEVPPRIVAVIQYSGWNNDEKMKKYSSILTNLLIKEGIKHKGEFTFMGYNAPFDFINRRNEIMVELTDYRTINE